jgi:hypothetical protein
MNLQTFLSDLLLPSSASKVRQTSNYIEALGKEITCFLLVPCPALRPSAWRQNIPKQFMYICIRLHWVTPQKFILIMTSDLRPLSSEHLKLFFRIMLRAEENIFRVFFSIILLVFCIFISLFRYPLRKTRML